MARFACLTLEEAGYVPRLAYYAPYRVRPELSVPAFALIRRRPGYQDTDALDGRRARAIGAWLPELEFTHFRLAPAWNELIAATERRLVVSGNCLAATAYVSAGVPFLSWIATSWEADRVDRVRKFPPARRLLDAAVVRPVARRLERRILRHGHHLALSEYTRRQLSAVRDGERTAPDIDVLPMPVDVEAFSGAKDSIRPGRIGFSGRLDDPRKNIELLLAAMAGVATAAPSAELFLLGGPVSAKLERQFSSLGLDKKIKVLPFMPHEVLIPLLQTLDVFVIPSHQEGLCIAALEAMACGCPVVSTRCGGPEEYVISGETGFLCDAEPDAMAAAVLEVISDRRRRDRLGNAARRLVAERYNKSRAQERFWASFESAHRTLPTPA